MGIMCTKCKVRPGQVSHSYCKPCLSQYQKDRKEKRTKELELLERLDVGLKAWEKRRADKIETLTELNVDALGAGRPDWAYDIDAVMTKWDADCPRPTLEHPDWDPAN